MAFFSSPGRALSRPFRIFSRYQERGCRLRRQVYEVYASLTALPDLAEVKTLAPSYSPKFSGGGKSGCGRSITVPGSSAAGWLIQYVTDCGQKIRINTRISCRKTHGMAPQ